MNLTSVSCRDAIRTVGAATLGTAAWNGWKTPAKSTEINPTRKRSLRLAHLTDIHVQPEKRAAEGFAACLDHVQSLKDPIELILMGGDSVMESFDADDARTKEQWDVWNDVLKNHCSLPIRAAIGNHDIWGWDKAKSKTTGKEPNYGKRRALDMLRLDNRYYTFTQGGWQFIVLDSLQNHLATTNGYLCYVDDEQYDWLESTLRDVPATTPIVILSHVPIISPSVFIWSNQDDGSFVIPKYVLHSDYTKLKNLFAKHQNVKISLSGHLHTQDHVDYNGVAYLCNGAVSGNWWDGRFNDTDEGYAVLNLFDDGTFEHEYIKYGWKVEALG